MEVAALGLRIDSGPVDKAASDLDRLTHAAGRAERAATDLRKGGDAATRAMNSMDAAARKSSVAMANLAQVAARVGVMLGAALSVRALQLYADSWSDMQSRVGAAVKNMEAAPALMRRIVDIANASYSPLAQTVEIYSRNVAVLRQMGKSATEAADFTESLNHMLVITATRGQRAASVQDALSKAMAVGRLQADGLETVLANGGRVAEALAQALGTSVNGLRDMASQGKITSDVIASALIGSLDKVRAEAAEMPATIDDAFTRLQTNITEFIGRLDQASGVSSAVAEGLIDFADGIRTTTNYMVAFGQFAAPAFDAVGAAISGLAGYADIALAAVAGFASPALIAGVWALSAALATGVAGGVKAITAAMMANPIGLLVGALSAGVYAAYKFRDDIQEAIGVDVVDVFKTSANFVIGSFVGAYDNVKFVWNNFGDMMGAAVIGGVNIAIRAINGLIQKAAEGVDGLIALINKIPGVDVGSIGKSLGINEIANPYANRLGVSFSQLNERAAIAMNRDYIGALGERFKALRTAAQAEDEFRRATEAAGKATGGTTKATGAATKAQQEFERERRSALVAQYQSISAIHAQAQGLEDQVALFGLSKSALEDLTIARLEEQAAVLRGFDGSQEQVEAIEREIEARKRLRTAIGSLEQKEAERQAWEDWARDVERIFDRVGQSLTDAIFDGGKSGKELLKDIFKSLTFNVLINPVVGAMQGWVTNQLGGVFGVQNPAQGGGILGTAQNLYSGYNAITGGLNSTLGNAAQWLGQKVGSEALTSFGLGLSGTTAATGIASIGAGLGASLGTTIGTSAATMASTSFAASMTGGAIIPGLGVGAAGGGVGAGIGAAGAAAGGAAAGGAAGFGAAFGAALPWIGGALAIGGLLGGGLFDREPTTRRGQRARVDFMGGRYGVTSTDDRQPGAEAAIRQMAQQAVESANALMRQTGVDAAIDAFYAITESSIKGDRQGVASGGTLRIGDRLIGFGLREASDMTLAGFGGWSEAEMLPRLAVDIQLSMLEAFQALGDQLPNVLSDMLKGIDVRSLGAEEAQALTERFAMLTQGASAFLAAVEQMPFAELRDLTFDAAAGMVQFAGGLDNLLTAQQTYYERFYSDAERHAHAVDQLTQALAGVGVEMPALVGSTDDMLASYRALVESLDLNTEAGQQAYVTLMQNAGAFADVAEFAGQAAVEAARYAEQVLREREGLERQLLQLQGDTAELRRRELEALDESNHALQERIWELQDQAEAEAKAAEILRGIEQERAGIERQILQITGDTAAIRALELAALDESNRALQERYYMLQDEAAAAQAAAAIERERYGLEKQLLQLQGDTDALRARELAALDESNRALQERIWAYQDEQAAAAEAAQQQAAITQEREGLERALLQVQGDTAAIRALELAALDPSNRALQERIFALEDEQKAAAEAAQRMAEINQEREGLERQLLQLQGDTAAIRALELAALAPVNQALQERIWALEDEQKAAAEAAQRMAEITQEREGLERALLQALGDTAGLRAQELAALDPSNRALQSRIWGLLDEAEITQERTGLETQLLQLQGDTLALRRRELAALHPSNHEIQERIWALQDEQEITAAATAIQNERLNLESALLQALGMTAEIRRRELDALDSTNRALQAHIYALEDQSAAVDSARAALDRAARAERERLDVAHRGYMERLNEQATAQRDALSQAEQALSSVSRTVQGLRLEGLEQDRMRREAAQTSIAGMLSAGVVSPGDDLDRALAAVAEPGEQLFGSFTDYARDYARTHMLMADLESLASEQVTVEERTLQAVEGRISRAESQHQAELARLDDALAMSERQYNVLMGIDDSVLSVRDAVAGLGSAMAALAAGRIDASTSLSIPGFASGGFHLGGARIVGEREPELEITPPSRIFSHNDSRSILDFRGIIDELKSIGKRLEKLEQYQYQTTKNTGETSKILRRVEFDGLPVREMAE